MNKAHKNPNSGLPFTTTVFLLFTFLVVVVGFLIYKSSATKPPLQELAYSESQKREAPLIHKSDFPGAVLGLSYQTDVITSIAIRGEIGLSVDGLPQGLTLQDCKTTYDVEVVPVKPNSVRRCLIKGVPSETGLFTVTITAANPSGVTTTIKDLSLNVSENE